MSALRDKRGSEVPDEGRVRTEEESGVPFPPVKRGLLRPTIVIWFLWSFDCWNALPTETQNVTSIVACKKSFLNCSAFSSLGNLGNFPFVS